MPIEETGKEIGNLSAAQIDASVEPCAGEDRWDVRIDLYISGIGNWGAGIGKHSESLGIELIHAPEAAKLALHAVEIAVMVFVAGDEPITADVVVSGDALDDVHRERQ